MDTDLPPGWRKIHDTLGTYYWHVPTGTTQWQHPAHTTSPGGCLKADGEETLQETVGDVGRGVLVPTTRQKPAVGAGGLLKDPLGTLSCLPLEQDSLCHPKVLLLVRVKPLEGLQEGPCRSYPGSSQAARELRLLSWEGGLLPGASADVLS